MMPLHGRMNLIYVKQSHKPANAFLRNVSNNYDLQIRDAWGDSPVLLGGIRGGETVVIEFGRLGAGNTADTVLHPREIFSVLPAKAERYQYPRDVQTEVSTPVEDGGRHHLH